MIIPFQRLYLKYSITETENESVEEQTALALSILTLFFHESQIQTELELLLPRQQEAYPSGNLELPCWSFQLDAGKLAPTALASLPCLSGEGSLSSKS